MMKQNLLLLPVICILLVGFCAVVENTREEKETVRRELAIKTTELTCTQAREKLLEARLDEISERLESKTKLDRVFPATSPPLRSGTFSADEFERRVLPVIALVECGKTSGSGVCIASEGDMYYFISSYHVISKVIRDSEAEKAVDIQLFPVNKKRELTAKIVAWSAKKDLALLSVKSADKLEVAKIADCDVVRGLKLFEPMLVVGCPLGNEPFPTSGVLAGFNKVVDGEKFWMTSAPTTFGNSGGGVFLQDFRLIGITSMICTYDNIITMPIYHMSIFTPIPDVLAWLDSKGFSIVEGSLNKSVNQHDNAVETESK